MFQKVALKILLPVVRSIFDTAGDFNCFTPPNQLDDTQRLMRRQSSGHTPYQQQNQALQQHQTNYLSLHL